MNNYDVRAATQIKQSAAKKDVKQRRLVSLTGTSSTALSRIFNGQRQRIGVSEFIALHRALGNCPGEQFNQLLQTETDAA